MFLMSRKIKDPDANLWVRDESSSSTSHILLRKLVSKIYFFKIPYISSVHFSIHHFLHQ